MSEQSNAVSKLCAVCERAKILKSMDLCTGCATAAENEARSDFAKMEAFAAKHRTYDELCRERGIDPYED